MTPEERAQAVMDEICETQPGVEASIELIAAAIREAEAEEREACAKVADELDAEAGWDAYAQQVATLIRARSSR